MGKVKYRLPGKFACNEAEAVCNVPCLLGREFVREAPSCRGPHVLQILGLHQVSRQHRRPTFRLEIPHTCVHELRMSCCDEPYETTPGCQCLGIRKPMADEDIPDIAFSEVGNFAVAILWKPQLR